MLTILQAVQALFNAFLASEDDQEVQLRAAVELRDYFAAEAQRIADEAGIELPDPCDDKG